MFRQVTYISTARQPGPSLLADIERSAMRRNGALDLTGVLLFDGVRFLQVIEGPAEAMEPMLARIADDDRHFGMVMLRDVMVEARGFGGWAMLCKRVSEDQHGLLDLLRPLMRDADRTTRALFESFAEIRSAKAA
jgi:Sensors of blue-light using FAD